MTMVVAAQFLWQSEAVRTDLESGSSDIGEVLSRHTLVQREHLFGPSWK